ncbi:hypothetical protein CEE39_02360 [bacterium (candidate division B38) B3_B38]|nr:MAG: hypothetical protein CEE39_02360 [bacterium (candidate division B38) B3_B38]
MMGLEEIVLLVGGVSFLLVVILHFFWLMKRPQAGGIPSGTLRVADHIIKGFIRRQFAALCMVMVALFFLLGWQLSWAMGSTFLLGGVASLIIGHFTLRIAARTDERLPQQKKWARKRETIAYQAAGLTGLLVASLGMLAMGVLLKSLRLNLLSGRDISGFALGISLVSLAMYMSGEVFALGAIRAIASEGESSPPSSSPELASAARLVKNRLGNFAGVSVGLFACYGASAAALTITGMHSSTGGSSWEELLLLLIIAGFGASVIGYLFARIRRGFLSNFGIPSILSFALLVLAIYLFSLHLPQGTEIWEVSLLGLITGMAILGTSEYYVRSNPARAVARSASTGIATNIISGFASGMQSTAVPIVTLCLAVYLVHRLLGLFGMGVATMALSSVMGIFLALSCQESLVEEERASSSKGLVLGFSAVASIALFTAYYSVEGIDIIDIASPRIIASLLLGGLIPFFIASLVISSLRRASREMSKKLSPGKDKQKGIREDKWLTLVAKFSANASLKEMALPGIIALGTPPMVGFLMGREALGGLLGGVVLSGIVLSIFMTNGGGAWQGARIFMERGKRKGGSSGDCSVYKVGDLIGETLREGVSPLINSVVIVMAVTSVIVATLLKKGFL